MNLLDTRTVLISWCISNAICALVMASLWRQNRRHAPAMNYWLADYVMQFAAVMLIALRGSIPDALSVLLATPLIFVGTFVLYVGMEQYLHKTSSQRHNYVLLLLYLAVHAYFSLVQPSLAARNINISAAMLLLNAQFAWLMLRRVDADMRADTRMIGWIFAAYGAISLFRIVVDLLDPPGSDLLRSGLYDTAVILTYQMLYIALTFGLFLLVNRQLFGRLERDNAELRRAQQALRESEERYRALVDSSPIGIGVHRAGKILYLNPAAARLLGATSPAELVGTPILDRVHPDYREMVLARTAKAMQEGGAMPSMEEKFLRLDGGVIDVEIQGTPVRFEGAPAIQVSFADITQRKRAEDAVRASEEKFAKAFRASPVFIAISTVAEGRYVEVNEGFLRQTGRTREEIIGHTSQEIGLWQDPADRRRIIDVLREHGSVNCVEAALRRKSGEVMICEIWAEPIEIDAQPCVIWVTNDITARKKADAARAALEAQLRESQKMEAIGTLAGGIAHDFNNLLAVILGNAALARQDAAADPELARSVEEIEKAAQRAKGLVRQILAFSRRQTLEPVNQPLQPVIEDGLRLLRATLPAGVELEVSLAAALLHARVDANQIEQVLMNLCTNAWHAMAGHVGRIEVVLERRTFEAKPEPRPGGLAPGHYALLSVKDDGAGMDAATQARIFEPFFTTKAPGQGTGLGLSVVHGIVEAHHGAIEVQSAPGSGTTVCVYLPLSPPAQSAVPSAPASDAAQGGGKRVLYVDDEEALVVLVQRMLDRLGYRTSGFLSAHDAVEAVRAAPHAFDLVVSDYNMPGTSGLEVARELRRIREDLPVILVSGYVTDELRDKAAQAGVREVVYKPNTVEELCATIHRLLAPAAKPDPTPPVQK